MKPKQEVLAPAPHFPEPIRYVWDWYQEVRGGVQGNGNTYPVVTWEALHCWSRLTRQEVSPREARTIIALSNMWAGIMGEKKPDGGKN
jgi:hypothetical protein